MHGLLYSTNDYRLPGSLGHMAQLYEEQILKGRVLYCPLGFGRLVIMHVLQYNFGEFI